VIAADRRKASRSTPGEDLTVNASMFLSGAGITMATDANDHVIYNTNDGWLY
jgi:hypothetical protein